MEVFRGAGCVFVAKDTGRICLGLRSRFCEDSGTWSTWGGKMDPDETPEETVRREVREEAGYAVSFKLKPLNVYRTSGFEYHAFAAVVDKEFEPDLNWEHIKFEWSTLAALPKPLHFGIPSLIPHLERVIAEIQKNESTSAAKSRERFSSMTIKHFITAKYRLAEADTPKDFFMEPRDQGAVEPRNGGYEARAVEDCKCNCGCDCEKCSTETKDQP